MVRKQIIGLLLMLPILAHAEVNLEFQSVGIVELVQTVVKGIMKRDYVISPEVLGDGRKVTISLKNKSEENIKNIMTDFLRAHDIAMNERGGLIFIERLSKAEQPAALDQVPVNLLDQLSAMPSPSELLTPVQSDPDQPPPPIRTYKPRYRSADELQKLVSFAGAMAVPVQGGDRVVYSATDQQEEMLQQVFQSLDVQQSQVMVKAYLYEVSRTQREGSAFNAVVELLKGKLQINMASITQANTIKLSLPDVTAVFSALDSDNRFNVISSPSLRVTHAKTSRFSVGSETPVLGAITAYTNGQPVQSVEYRPSGVILELKPMIYETGIDLDIMQQVSNFVPTTSGVNNSPTLIKRELKTTISTQDGDLILMGGLDETKDANESTGIPLLPQFLRSRFAEKGKTDILLVLHVQRI